MSFDIHILFSQQTMTFRCQPSLLAKDIFPSQQPSPPSKEKVGIDQGWTIDGTQSFHCRHGLGRLKMDSSL